MMATIARRATNARGGGPTNFITHRQTRMMTAQAYASR